MASIVSAGTTSATALNMSADTSGVLQLASNNGTTAVTIDTSQNVGVGTSSPGAKLDANGTIRSKTSTGGTINMDSTAAGTTNTLGSYANAGAAFADFNLSANNTIFLQAGTERVRIDSSGNLLVGSTSNVENARLFAVLATNTASVIQANNAYAASSGLTTFYSSLGNGTNSVSNTNCYHLKAISQGSAIYYLYGNGTTSFTSDQRLKKNIETTRNGYAQDLCKLRVVKYQWNTEPDDGPKELGLIAQEVEQVFPGLVQDAADEIQGIKPKVLKASVLPMMLLKAIQEQQALITQLQADVAALKGAV